MEIGNIIDSTINIDKVELKKKLKEWESKDSKDEPFEEYILRMRRIELTKTILY